MFQAHVANNHGIREGGGDADEHVTVGSGRWIRYVSSYDDFSDYKPL